MKIKICGLTDPKEAGYVNEQRVDFIGMVLFFPKSKRNITLDRAREIMKWSGSRHSEGGCCGDTDTGAGAEYRAGGI